MSEECFFQSDDLEEALSLYKEENRGKIKKLSDIDEKLAKVNEQPVLDTCDSQINRHIFKTNLST